MLEIPCPWCGLRNQTEFLYGGQAGIDRPATPEKLSNQRWGEYLLFRQNPKGFFTERWMHSLGCRRWFIIERHTMTNEIKNSSGNLVQNKP